MLLQVNLGFEQVFQNCADSSRYFVAKFNLAFLFSSVASVLLAVYSLYVFMKTSVKCRPRYVYLLKSFVDLVKVIFFNQVKKGYCLLPGFLGVADLANSSL